MNNAPIMVVLASFVITFITTRIVTRLIRAGRGPFSDNLTSSGIHVHHAVPGIFLLLAGAVINTASTAAPIRCAGALAIGVGASLVLDEFALILRLEDVYWRHEGRSSVQAVALTAACLSLTCLGFSPITNEMLHEPASITVVEVMLLGATLAAAVVSAKKGKYRLVLLSIFIWPLAYIGAIRLARPGSPWFARHYRNRPDKAERARRRAARSDARWNTRLTNLADLIAGAPTQMPPQPTRTDIPGADTLAPNPPAPRNRP